MMTLNNERVAALLEELQDLIPEGPEHPHEQRRNALTPADLVLISEVIKRTTTRPCDDCFSSEEIGILKHLVQWGIRGLALVGTLIVTAIIGTLIAIFGKGFGIWLKGH